MAVLLGQSGVACVLVARRGDRLQEIADRYSNFEVLEADLTTDEGCAKVVARIADEQQRVLGDEGGEHDGFNRIETEHTERGEVGQLGRRHVLLLFSGIAGMAGAASWNKSPGP